YRPFSGNRSVLRVGYGLFYDSLQSLDVSYGSWMPPFQGALVTYTKPIQWPDHVSRIKPLDQAPFSQADLDSRIGGLPGIYANNPHWPASYNQQWNVSFGQDIGWGTKFELGYLGSHGVNLSGLLSGGMNAENPGLCAKSKLINPPGGGGCGWLWTKGFNSTYSSLQASVHKGFTHGLFFLAGYTWSHSLAQASQDDDYTESLLDSNIKGRVFERRWANSDFDVRHRLSIEGGYELPMGRGKHFGSAWHPVVDGVLGGWQVNWIAQFQAGFPFTVWSARLAYPDRICDGNLPSNQRTRDKWFDYNCFVPHTPTTAIDPTTGAQILTNINGNSGLNILTGPGTNNWDLSVQKHFRLWNETRLQFRGEFFNAFNHPNLTAPAGNTFYNDSGGAKIYRGRDARDIQLALKLIF
ncbi:MAG: hypothetical protein DMG07_21170, partial [Acidobacteria bacterium]